MAINFDKQNERVLGWAKQTSAALKLSGNALGIRHRQNSPSNGASLDRIAERARYKGSIIEVISFKFPRSLIYPHKGAGKGRGGLLGSTWYDKYGLKHTTNPNSLGKMDTGGRVAKPWFNDAIEAPTGVDELATIVAEESGDAIINKLLIK